jgi:hypothetical protein
MLIESEDVYVTKLVYLVTKIPKHLNLHFYDSYMNFYTFSKFAGQKERRASGAVPGKLPRWRCGPRRGNVRGVQGLPLEGLGVRGGGLRQPRRERRRPAAVAGGGGGVLVEERRGMWGLELHWGVE